VKKDFGNFFKNGNFENDKALVFGGHFGGKNRWLEYKIKINY
jgi:hypothetical protein